MSRLVIVSNRVSLPAASGVQAGGLAVAIEEMLRSHGGIWFGWSGAVAEQPSAQPSLHGSGTVVHATVDLTRADYERYYLGYANGTLWPMLHFRLGLVEYDRRNFEAYLAVNAAMAKALVPLIEPGDLIWIHDYHLIPFAAELRRLGVANPMGFFLHTPLPPAEVIAALPHHETLIEALAAYDLVGFQTSAEQAAFLGYIGSKAGGEVFSDGRFSAFGRRARAAVFPIGIDPVEFAGTAERAATSATVRRLRETLLGRALIIGVDRLDYSKGIPDRFEAIHALLSRFPEYRRRFTYLQITPHSRSEVRQYRDLRRRIDSAAGRANGSFSEFDWTPIRYINKSFSRQTLSGFYRLARVGLVTPFRDGMNLVAKEFIAAQDPADPGVLVLSQFAGAAAELDAALLINPLDVEAIAEAIHKGLSMPLDERRQRWEASMAALRANPIGRWRRSFVDALHASRRVVAE